MAIGFDPAKNERNIAERGLSFERVADLEWDTGLVGGRRPPRLWRNKIARLRPSRRRLHIAVVTPRGRNLRFIGFRKANCKEERWYETEKARRRAH
jgi:uncharacterized DUF497 family protein